MGSSYLKLKDGTELFYKDWGTGDPIVFSHGWPLNSDAFEDQMLYLGLKGYRVIAHDRRGHGRSSQPWDGHNMTQYADDLAELVEHLDLKNAVFVGHSTGGGEVTRYLARHGTKRASKAVLIGAVPPLLIKSESNPDGVPKDVFDSIRDGIVKDRASFFKTFPAQFYGFNREDNKESKGLVSQFLYLGLQASIKALYDCVAAFSETDQTEDLKKIDIPVLVLYGDDDQIVPPKVASEAALKLLPHGEDKVYPGGSHGMCSTHKNQVSSDIYDFIKGNK